jgi:uncharacterized membrane protein
MLIATAPPPVVMPLCVVSGIALIGLGIPLYRRRVPPNALYGVRLRSTLDDDELWYDVNARAGRDFIVIGTAFLVALGVAQTIGRAWDPVVRILVPLVLLVFGLMIETIAIVRLANRMSAGRGSSVGARRSRNTSGS